MGERRAPTLPPRVVPGKLGAGLVIIDEAQPGHIPGVRLHSDGYVLVRVGDHPMANDSGWAYLHHLVYATAGEGGAGIARFWQDLGHQIHHRNGRKADNRIGNLTLVCRREHSRAHAATKPRDDGGKFAKRDTV